MNIINLAHVPFLMLGAYLTYQLFASFHVDPFLSLPISFVVLFALGYLIQRFLINWVARAPILTTFLLTFGLSLLMVNIALLIWTGDQRGHQREELRPRNRDTGEREVRAGIRRRDAALIARPDQRDVHHQQREAEREQKRRQDRRACDPVDEEALDQVPECEENHERDRQRQERVDVKARE